MTDISREFTKHMFFTNFHRWYFSPYFPTYI